MHIPTEMVYIFLKNWGVKQGREYNGYSEIQVNSCSRCGICINTCQLNSSCDINDTQPVYFLRRIRNHEPLTKQAEDCLMCGRCEASCPVGINLNAIRQSQRPDTIRVVKDTYAYVPQPEVKTCLLYTSFLHLDDNLASRPHCELIDTIIHHLFNKYVYSIIHRCTVT